MEPEARSQPHARHLRQPHVVGDGWIELGQDEVSRSLVRILDSGGLIWESDQRYSTVAEALAAAELALSAWVEENL